MRSPPDHKCEVMADAKGEVKSSSEVLRGGSWWQAEEERTVTQGSSYEITWSQTFKASKEEEQ
jgi:hypothetical protein